MTAHEQYEELIAAYALDALSAEDRRAFEGHLSTCATCTAMVDDLRRVSASLGLAADPVAPPPSLRARTIARATASPVPGAGVADTVRKMPVGERSARWSPLAAAASLVCIAGLVLYVLSLRAQLGSTRDMLAEAIERVDSLRRDVAEARTESARLANTVGVLRAGDVIRVDLRGLEPVPSASGRAYVSAARGVVFIAERLPGLAANRSYQLWVVPEGAGAAAVSAGVFSVDSAGNSFVSNVLPTGVSTVSAVAVTEEPAGGSIKATTSPLLLGLAVNN